MFLQGGTTLKCLFQRGVRSFHTCLSGAYESLTISLTEHGILMQTSKSWATCILCLCYLSSLATKNYQYSKTVETVGTISMMGGGVPVVNVIQYRGYASDQAHLLKETPPLPET